MLNELGEYVTDVDSEISRRSIQALGRIAIRLPSMASAIVK
jgi:AP-4 complex subunit beta-1